MLTLASHAVEANEIVELLNRAAVEGMQDYVDEALLSLAEALCCDECGGTGWQLSPLAVLDKPCPKCGPIRSAVRRWKEGRDGD